ncbi:MAG TPA: glutathione S-transferase N-terminal domain-containing protein [Xanthobacteraceae bacterium]|jgi:GST-like protein|nr:glutathione S-transferase N-terminal domain-containing protein [Xanthobacteraceae bacterium]
MLDLYFWTTPNGYKVTILLEELGLEYNVVPVHIGKGEQFNPDFLKISPNNKIPALVDQEAADGKPLALFESGAIMMYLAEKAGFRFMPAGLRQRYDVVQWLMFQMGGIGPMLGQAHHFRRYAKEQIPYAIERYTDEATRLYRVLDKRLGEAEYLAGEYSIADMAVYPWLRPHKWQGQDVAAWPNLQRWYGAVRARPAVQRGLAVMADRLEKNWEKPTGYSWDVLFGQKQFEAR